MHSLEVIQAMNRREVEAYREQQAAEEARIEAEVQRRIHAELDRREAAARRRERAYKENALLLAADTARALAR